MYMHLSVIDMAWGVDGSSGCKWNVEALSRHEVLTAYKVGITKYM